MLFGLVSVALALAPADNADFKRGNELFAQYKYPEARAAMAKARGVKGLTRGMLLRILEVQAVAAAQQRQTAAAQAAFRELLVLDPDHTLEAEYAPRVMTPFFEAHQAAQESGALEFKAGPVETSKDKVETVSVVLARDPLKQARGVRFHLKAGGEEWRTTDVALKDGQAVLVVGAPEVSWWAEALGDNECQLQLVGAEAAPRVERPPPPLVIAPPVEVAPPPPQVVAPAPSGAPVRAVSYGVLGAALVAGGVGAYFAFQSNSALAQIDYAARNSSGTITGLTEKAANDLNNSGKQNALIGNGLFIGAGALAVGGALIWWFGAPVAVAPAPSGVIVSGRLP